MILRQGLERQRGQALTEHLILFPALVLLVMGILQFSLLYRAKATLNHATFMAARAGALNYASGRIMRDKLIEGMAPLELRNGGTNVANWELTKTRNYLENGLIPEVAGGAKLVIVSPTKEIFDAFAKPARELVACEKNCPHGGNFRESSETYMQIPNDNLGAHGTDTEDFKYFEGDDEATGYINIQDANLLKIRTHWCYGMEVPVVNWVMHQALWLVENSNSLWRVQGEHRGAWLNGNAPDHARDCLDRNTDNGSHYFIPLTSSSVIRMQTPVRCEGDEHDGEDCVNLPET